MLLLSGSAAQLNGDPESAHGGLGACAGVAGESEQDIPPVAIWSFSVAKQGEQVDLPVEPIFVATVVIIDVADHLRDGVRVGVPDEEWGHDGGAAQVVLEVPEDGGGDMMPSVPIFAKVEEGQHLGGPTSEVSLVIEEGSEPEGARDPVALLIGPKGEEGRRLLPRAGVGIEEGEHQLAIQTDTRITVVPVQGGDHVELGRAPVPCVPPGDECVSSVLMIFIEEEGRDQQVLLLIATIMEEGCHGGVALLLTPDAPIEGDHVEELALLSVSSVVGAVDVHPLARPLVVLVVVEQRWDGLIEALLVLPKEVKGCDTQVDVLGGACVASGPTGPGAERRADQMKTTLLIPLGHGEQRGNDGVSTVRPGARHVEGEEPVVALGRSAAIDEGTRHCRAALLQRVL